MYNSENCAASSPSILEQMCYKVYLGFILIGEIRYAGMEMTVMKKSFIHSARKAGSTTYHAGLPKEASEWVRRQKDGVENVGKSLYCGFDRKEWVKQAQRDKQV